jgi:hypothetical protein
LQIEADRDQGIKTAQDHAAQNNFNQSHDCKLRKRRPARK